MKDCLNCDKCRIVRASDGFSFKGCYHEPFVGKWIIEIKKCPKKLKEVKRWIRNC